MSRQKDFKKGLGSGESLTERRVEGEQKLRRRRRDAHLKRIRRGDEPGVFSEEQARALVQGLQTGPPESRSAALKGLCALTASDDPHLSVLHSLHLVAVLQKILTGPHGHDQYDAMWCLTNLATGDHDTTVLIYPSLPYVINLLGSDSVDVAEQAAWCLGNVAGDCEECRARVAQNGAVVPMLALLRRPKPSPDLLATLGFAVCNMLRGGQLAEPFLRGGLLGLILPILSHPEETNATRAELLWVLSFLTSGPNEAKAAVVAAGTVEVTSPLLEGKDKSAIELVPLLRTLGNVGAGPDPVVMAVAQSPGLLPRLWALLAHPDPAVLRELCWALGSLTGGPDAVCGALVQQGFVPPLAALFNGAVMAVRKEVGYVFLNLVSALRDHSPILPLLVSTPGVVPGFVECMNLPDVEMVEMGIRWAAIMLKHHPNGKNIFEENGGLLALEDLEYNPHKNDQLFSKANSLLDKYFTDMCDFEDARADSEARELAFAMQQQGQEEQGFNF